MLLQQPIAPLCNRGPIARLLTGCALAVSAMAVPGMLSAAQPGGRELPTNVEADRLQHDDANQTTVFSGNVVLTRGPLTIRGDRVVMKQVGPNAQEAQTVGNPAYFRQLREPNNQVIEGTAQRIDYDSSAEKVTLTGNARLKRFECNRPSDEITGAMVVYDAKTELFTVDGRRMAQKGRSDGRSPEDSPATNLPDAGNGASGRGRVRVIIQPRQEGSAQQKSRDCPPHQDPPSSLAPAPSLSAPR